MINAIRQRLLDVVGILRIRDDGDFLDFFCSGADGAQDEQAEKHADSGARLFHEFH